MHTKDEVTAAIRDLWSQVLESGGLPGDIELFHGGRQFAQVDHPVDGAE